MCHSNMRAGEERQPHFLVWQIEIDPSLSSLSLDTANGQLKDAFISFFSFFFFSGFFFLLQFDHLIRQTDPQPRKSYLGKTQLTTVSQHMFADDIELYTSDSPSETYPLARTISDVKVWVVHNKLQLNDHHKY